MGQNNDYHQILIVFKVKKKIYRKLLSLFSKNRRNSKTISIDTWTKGTNHCTPAGGKYVQLVKGCQHLWNGLLIKIMNNTRNHPGQQRESSCLVQRGSLSSLITKKMAFILMRKRFVYIVLCIELSPKSVKSMARTWGPMKKSLRIACRMFPTSVLLSLMEF